MPSEQRVKIAVVAQGWDERDVWAKRLPIRDSLAYTLAGSGTSPTSGKWGVRMAGCPDEVNLTHLVNAHKIVGNA